MRPADRVGALSELARSVLQARHGISADPLAPRRLSARSLVRSFAEAGEWRRSNVANFIFASIA